MSNTLVFDCPSCNAKNQTFDVQGYNPLPMPQIEWEFFSICRRCKAACCLKGSIRPDATSNLRNVGNVVFNSITKLVVENLKAGNQDIGHFFHDFHHKVIIPESLAHPQYLPSKIENIFIEATKCLTLDCYNAAGSMFRLCLDITTKKILEKNEHLHPSNKDKNTIHSRLVWIFEKQILNNNLEELSRCIKDDGNDAAHDGSLTKDDAYNLYDFTYELLEQVFTQPERIKLARERRQQRKNDGDNPVQPIFSNE